MSFVPSAAPKTPRGGKTPTRERPGVTPKRGRPNADGAPPVFAEEEFPSLPQAREDRFLPRGRKDRRAAWDWDETGLQGARARSVSKERASSVGRARSVDVCADANADSGAGRGRGRSHTMDDGDLEQYAPKQAMVPESVQRPPAARSAVSHQAAAEAIATSAQAETKPTQIAGAAKAREISPVPAKAASSTRALSPVPPKVRLSAVKFADVEVKKEAINLETMAQKMRAFLSIIESGGGEGMSQANLDMMNLSMNKLTTRSPSPPRCRSPPPSAASPEAGQRTRRKSAPTNPNPMFAEPPHSDSWDFPMSREEKKSRVVMLERQILTADNQELRDVIQEAGLESPKA